MPLAYINVDGETCIEARLVVPNIGPWYAEVTFQDSPDLSGAVVLSLGVLRLSGTIDVSRDGTFGAQRRSRIVGGGNGWGVVLEPLHYHNDAGVRALGVAQDAARLAGEQLGTFEPTNESIGVDYVRQSGHAARVLEDVIGGVEWWVDYDGVTQVGMRDTSEPSPGTYEVLDFNPRERIAEVAIDDLTKVGIGSILTEGLDAPLTVRELDIRVSADSSRTTVWGGSEAGERGRLAGLLTGIARRALDGQLFGKYRYRVTAISGDRLELQVVTSGLGLPDALPLSMRPGVTGAHGLPAAGSVVFVEFVEGNRALPIVTAFAGKDEEGHEPTELDFSASATLRLGSGSASEGVSLGDSLKSWLDGHGHAYIDHISGVSTPSVSGPPVAGAPPGMPDPSPSPSAKVKVE